MSRSLFRHTLRFRQSTNSCVLFRHHLCYIPLHGSVLQKVWNLPKFANLSLSSTYRNTNKQFNQLEKMSSNKKDQKKDITTSGDKRSGKVDDPKTKNKAHSSSPRKETEVLKNKQSMTASSDESKLTTASESTSDACNSAPVSSGTQLKQKSSPRADLAAGSTAANKLSSDSDNVSGSAINDDLGSADVSKDLKSKDKKNEALCSPDKILKKEDKMSSDEKQMSPKLAEQAKVESTSAIPDSKSNCMKGSTEPHTQLPLLEKEASPPKTMSQDDLSCGDKDQIVKMSISENASLGSNKEKESSPQKMEMEQKDEEKHDHSAVDAASKLVSTSSTGVAASQISNTGGHSLFASAGSSTSSYSGSYGKPAATESLFTRLKVIKTERDRCISMPIEEKRQIYACGEDYTQLKDIETWHEYYTRDMERLQQKFPKKMRLSNDPRPFLPDAELASKVSLWRGDITALEIDTIVNAANSSLLGGGGVDGAIHRAAGSALYNECKTLNGCQTGEAKSTAGYKLPARYVIHTVGPTDGSRKKLTACYVNCLDQMRVLDQRSIAFCCVSTGVYGYPNDDACHVALRNIRLFLEKLKKEDKLNEIDRIVFCLFLQIDVSLYESWMQVYFPVPGPASSEDNGIASTVTSVSAGCSTDKKDASNSPEPGEKKLKANKDNVKCTSHTGEKTGASTDDEAFCIEQLAAASSTVENLTMCSDTKLDNTANSQLLTVQISSDLIKAKETETTIENEMRQAESLGERDENIKIEKVELDSAQMSADEVGSLNVALLDDGINGSHKGDEPMEIDVEPEVPLSSSTTPLTEDAILAESRPIEEPTSMESSVSKHVLQVLSEHSDSSLLINSSADIASDPLSANYELLNPSADLTEASTLLPASTLDESSLDSSAQSSVCHTLQSRQPAVSCTLKCVDNVHCVDDSDDSAMFAMNGNTDVQLEEEAM